jgi:hypothetical protein
MLMICLRTLLRIYEKNPTQKSLKIKCFLAAKAAYMTKKICFWGVTLSPEIGILQKLVRLEASTKPHVHQKFEIFWTNIASTMACPNFINGPKKWTSSFRS